MSEPSFQTRPVERPTEKRLDSWKEIAAYLNRDVTTVQRWEKREGLPVHRHLHFKRGTVYAFAAEVDEWTRSRNVPLSDGQNEADRNSNSTATLALGLAATMSSLRPWIYALTLLAVALTVGSFIWLHKVEHPFRNPLDGAQYQVVTDWGGAEQAAAISRDGQFIAFLSDRDGHMDVWVTQVGSDQFHNLTHGSAAELVNTSIRTLGFSPDGSLVTYWVRNRSDSGSADIGIWAVPTLGGEPRPYLEGVAEYDWSSDGRQLVYHTPGAGDTLLVSTSSTPSTGRTIFTSSAGLHSHFPLWSPDQKFIYFVHGSLPDSLGIWRIAATGGTPERVTQQNAQVAYPIFLDQHTLLYLATDAGGAGPWLYGMDVMSRIPHRVSAGVDRYTSLAGSADGQRLIVTLASPKASLWHLRIDAHGAVTSTLQPIKLTTSSGFRPRLGANCLLYVSVSGASESIWKLVNGAATELWRSGGAHIIGGPTISADGNLVAFSIRQNGRSLLYVMAADGANPRTVTGSLDLQGDPAWTPDSRAIITSATDHGTPRLFRVPLRGGLPTLIVPEYSLDPAWSPDGSFVLFSGPDIGTKFSVKAVKPDGSSYALKSMTLARGARHLAFLPGGRFLVVLRGEIEHKNLWLIDLQTGTERPLTNLPTDFDVRDFDLSPDGHEAVLERVQDRSEIVLIKLQQR